MRFQVPQFIDREMKIAGPLTFKQFIMFGFAAVIVVMLYLVLAKSNFFIFIFLTAALVIATAALAFMRVGGRSLPMVLGNFASFFVSSRLYVWKKKALPPRIVWKKSEPTKTIVRPKSIAVELTAVGKSKIGRMAADIETKR
ncbi:MAG: PrgI family protein [bacterium]|nr:PrgI family protein [bacterium]